jgi:hypothetical protein
MALPPTVRDAFVQRDHGGVKRIWLPTDLLATQLIANVHQIRLLDDHFGTIVQIVSHHHDFVGLDLRDLYGKHPFPQGGCNEILSIVGFDSNVDDDANALATQNRVRIVYLVNFRDRRGQLRPVLKHFVPPFGAITTLSPAMAHVLLLDRVPMNEDVARSSLVTGEVALQTISAVGVAEEIPPGSHDVFVGSANAASFESLHDLLHRGCAVGGD